MELVDELSLSQLRELLGGEFWIVRDSYIDQLREGVLELNRSIELHDIAALKALAHRLKGSSLDMGCSALTAQFAAVENTCAGIEDRTTELSTATLALEELIPTLDPLVQKTIQKLLAV